MACTFCRHRKIKCDGKRPCSSCLERESHNCVYTATTKAPKSYRLEKSNPLEERLARVESLLEALQSDKTPNSPATETPTPETNTARYESPKPDPLIQNNSVHIERFSGSHFHFCANPITFVNHLKKKIPTAYHNIFIPLEMMPSVFSTSVKRFESSWTEGPAVDLTRQKLPLEDMFLENYETVTKLLDIFYSQDILANFVCALEEVKALFALYSQDKGRKRGLLAESDLLIMNMAVVISVLALLDDIRRGIWKEDLFTLGRSDLKGILDQCLASSAILFRKILFLSEGIQTVKAIMLAVLYVEFNVSNSRLDRALLTLAIRYAQDVGLHEYEKYTVSTEEQALVWKKLWCIIEYFDVEMAYRKGVPPLIRLEDCLPKCEGMEKHSLHVINEILELDYESDYFMATYDFLRALSWVRNKSLSSASTFKYKTHLQVLEIIEDLKQEMADLAMLFPTRYRPVLVSEAPLDVNVLAQWVQSGEKMKTGRFLILVARLNFLSHLMFLNTIPFMYNMPSPDKLGKTYEELKQRSVDCARTILETATVLRCPQLPAMLLNCVIHHIVSAFLCLLYKCVDNTDDLQNSSDISLLIKVANSSFQFSDSESQEPIRDWITKEKKYELLCLAGLNIGCKIIDSKTEEDVLLNETEFNEHYSKLAQLFPSIFQEYPSTNSTNTSSGRYTYSTRPKLLSDELDHNQEINQNQTSKPSYEGYRKGEGSENYPNLNGFSALTVDYGVNSLHDFFFDGTFGI